jgi:hypothetical protein
MFTIHGGPDVDYLCRLDVHPSDTLMFSVFGQPDAHRQPDVHFAHHRSSKIY